MKGMIVRMNKAGLGIQSKRLVRMLKPDYLMVIDSSPFDGNTQQYPEWYKDYDRMTVKGFPTDHDIEMFLRKVDVVLTCETFYSNRFTMIARARGKKTIVIANPEFFDWLRRNFVFITEPDKVIVPSEWKMHEMKNYKAQYIPTPIFADEFARARETNLKRTGRKYLFVNGKTAMHDRNGLESLYEALTYAKGDFTVTVKTQSNVMLHLDKRLIYDTSNPEDQQELYEDYDALIMPRRWGGQCMPMCEALQCALPVVMTNVSPNYVLPNGWLVKADKIGSFEARTTVDIFSADPRELAYKLDTLDTSVKAKQKAYDCGKIYRAENLEKKYKNIWSI